MDIVPPMIKRPHYIDILSVAVKRSKVTALLGPRQCGKTTLARIFCEGKKTTFFDLESQPDERRNCRMIFPDLQLDEEKLAIGRIENLQLNGIHV